VVSAEKRLPTPLPLVRWPGRISAGQTSPHVWAFWDFLPTAAELAGAKTPDDQGGVSVVPTLLRRGQQRTHELLSWEFHEGGSQQAVRMGEGGWKAIRCKLGGPLELNDLAKDLGEAMNLADRHPHVIARIEAYLQTARIDSTAWPCRRQRPRNRRTSEQLV
jgi:arylsulfatase A-like enzyme